MRGIRKKPLFDHSIWNHHDYILEDREDTTNKSEAWYSASKHCMVMKNKSSENGAIAEIFRFPEEKQPFVQVWHKCPPMKI